MRDGALFLNLSRGFVVDHGALRSHIESGHLAGAAVDVFFEEPSENDQSFRVPPAGLPNVILTPHIGGSTEEAQVDIGQFVADKLADYARRGSTALSVNLPNVELPSGPGPTGWSTFIATRPACWPPSTPSSPSTASTSRDRHSAPAATSDT